jgi:DNA polymerase-1
MTNKKNEKNLFLLDINSHINRAFHKAKSNGDDEKDEAFFEGKPNYAIEKALNLIENEISRVGVRPDYIACILDHRGKNFRHELYPNYKANRDPTDPELAFMRECIFKLLHLKGYHLIRKSGVEADDVIGTLATKASAAGINTYILARDKDMFYLINENTYIFDGYTDVLYDIEGCIKKRGVHPSQMTDFLTMDGDKTDNIIGIPNCGVKTAISILKQNTLSEIIENPNLLKNKDIKIKGREKMINYIKENKSFILLMHTIVQLKDDLDLKCNLKDFIKNAEKTKDIELAFKSLGVTPKPNRYSGRY